MPGTDRGQRLGWVNLLSDRGLLSVGRSVPDRPGAVVHTGAVRWDAEPYRIECFWRLFVHADRRGGQQDSLEEAIHGGTSNAAWGRAAHKTYDVAYKAQHKPPEGAPCAVTNRG